MSTVEELLPLHVAGVAQGERLEVARHELGKLSPVVEAQILPEMIGPLRAPRNHAHELGL